MWKIKKLYFKISNKFQTTYKKNRHQNTTYCTEIAAVESSDSKAKPLLLGHPASRIINRFSGNFVVDWI